MNEEQKLKILETYYKSKEWHLYSIQIDMSGLVRIGLAAHKLTPEQVDKTAKVKKGTTKSIIDCSNPDLKFEDLSKILFIFGIRAHFVS